MAQSKPTPRTSSLGKTQSSGHLAASSSHPQRLLAVQEDEDAVSDTSIQARLRVPTLPKSTHLKDFDIQRTLGTGSFGRVHLVRYKPTGTYYAIKVLKKVKS